MVLLRRIHPTQPAPEVTDEVAEFQEAIREEHHNRGSQNSVAAAREPLRQYRTLRECLEDVGHDQPLENQLKVPPDALPHAVRDLAGRGLTNHSIMTEIGAANVETVQRLRRHLGCPDPDDVPPEAA